jgi:DNA-binding response OmpR family regulator
LRRENYTPITARDAPTAVLTARREQPDLILLDLMLPGGSGLDVCRDIRAFSSAPIIMLTARGEEIDRILGLEVGADDYISKPFALRELFARIKSNLRRVELDKGRERAATFEWHGLVVDIETHKASFNEQSISLQPREFDLIAYLMEHPGVVLPRRRLLVSVWGHEYVGERTVDVHIRRVRAKLEAAGAPPVIRTVHGVGYAFDPEHAQTTG